MTRPPTEAASAMRGMKLLVQAIFRRRHQPRRPPPAKIKPGSPAPAIGPGTPLKAFTNAEVVEVPPAAPTKSIWSFITKSDDIGANVATVDPGALRDNVT